MKTHKTTSDKLYSLRLNQLARVCASLTKEMYTTESNKIVAEYEAKFAEEQRQRKAEYEAVIHFHKIVTLFFDMCIDPKIVLNKMKEDGFDYKTKTLSECGDYAIDNF
jgi:hypothetical protein